MIDQPESNEGRSLSRRTFLKLTALVGSIIAAATTIKTRKSLAQTYAPFSTNTNFDSWWNGWVPITNNPNDLTASTFSKLTPPAIVARDANHLDLFVMGNDGRVWTNLWTDGINNNRWNGWFPISDNSNDPTVSTFSKQTPPAMVARSAMDLDLFVLATDSRVWTNWRACSESRVIL